LEAEINHYVDRCMFCGQCAEICPENAIRMSEEYELADFDRARENSVKKMNKIFLSALRSLKEICKKFFK